jgi:hypothetical protein
MLRLDNDSEGSQSTVIDGENTIVPVDETPTAVIFLVPTVWDGITKEKE